MAESSKQAARDNKGKPKLSYVLQFDTCGASASYAAMKYCTFDYVVQCLSGVMNRVEDSEVELLRAAVVCLALSSRDGTGVLPGEFWGLDFSGLVANCEFGAYKYERFGNYGRPFPITELLDAAMRHLNKAARGEEWVEDALEAGFRVRNTDAAAWNCLQALTQLSRGYAPEFDDRPKMPEAGE